MTRGANRRADVRSGSKSEVDPADAGVRFTTQGKRIRGIKKPRTMPGLLSFGKEISLSVPCHHRAAEAVVQADPGDILRKCRSLSVDSCRNDAIRYTIRGLAEVDIQILALDGPVGGRRHIRRQHRPCNPSALS
jgi:hypothetical protein